MATKFVIPTVGTPVDPLSEKIQIFFANQLSNKMYNAAGHLNNRLVGILGKRPELLDLEYKDELKEILVKEILDSSNSLAPYMLDYLNATTATNVDDILFVRNKEIFIEAARLTKKIQKSKSKFDATYAGSIMNKSITKQVDETQKRLIKPGVNLKGSWERHINSGACEYCKDQVDIYRNTGRWFRHANCRCFKIFVKK